MVNKYSPRIRVARRPQGLVKVVGIREVPCTVEEIQYTLRVRKAGNYYVRREIGPVLTGRRKS